jgi:drug/metabolite transporter (DMT)-like permease
VNSEPSVAGPEVHEASITTEGTNRVMLIGLILASVLLAALAQLTLKHGMNQVTADSGTATLKLASLKSMASNVFVVGGLVIFAVSAVIWLMVLSRASLSFAYPFASLSYLVIVLADRFVLGESVPPLRWVGVFLIMAGIVLVAQTPYQ